MQGLGFRDSLFNTTARPGPTLNQLPRLAFGAQALVLGHCITKDAVAVLLSCYAEEVAPVAFSVVLISSVPFV